MSEELYHLLLLKRSHGLARELPPELHPAIAAKHPDIDFKFLFLTDGTNFRSTELNAVLGSQQLARLDDFIRIRNRNFRRFVESCRRYPDELVTLDGAEVSSFSFAFLFKDREHKVAFQKLLAEAGIESRPVIGGNLLRQPFLSGYYQPGRVSERGFRPHEWILHRQQPVRHRRAHERAGRAAPDILRQKWKATR